MKKVESIKDALLSDAKPCFDYDGESDKFYYLVLNNKTLALQKLMTSEAVYDDFYNQTLKFNQCSREWSSKSEFEDYVDRNS